MDKNPPLSTKASRPFRFGIVAAAARSVDEWTDKARRAEALGYASLVMPENLQYTLAPFPALALPAAATRTLRLGTYVLPNDFRNQVMLAKEVGTLDLLSSGRLELGLGAGRPDAEAENRMLGLAFDSGAVRVARLAESLSILKQLLAGQAVSVDSPHYALHDAKISPLPAQQPHPPILVAGSGKQMLGLAAREADIVAVGLPPDATEALAAERIGWIRDAAGARFPEIELNMNVMAVGDRVPRWIESRMHVTASDLAERGSVAAVVGSIDQMCDTLHRRREQLGLSYLLVSDEFMEDFAPVVQRLAGQ